MKIPFKIRILQIVAQVSYYLGLTHLFRFCFRRKNRIIILMYHRVFDIKNIHDFNLDIDYLITPEEFERQIEYISEKYNAISFDDFIEYYEKEAKLPKNSIIITIDDGYKDCCTNIYFILKKYEVPAMFFIATDYIDSQELYWWDKVAYGINNTDLLSFSVPELGAYTLENPVKRPKVKREICKKLRRMSEETKNRVVNDLAHTLNVDFDSINKDLFLTWEEIKEMGESGMDFGAHTCSHAILTKVPYEQAEYEIMESKRVIESQINKKVNFFSYPSGTINDFNDKIKECVKSSGLVAVVSTIYGINKLNSETDLYSLKRIEVDTNIYLFKLKLTGVLDCLYRIRNKLKRKG